MVIPSGVTVTESRARRAALGGLGLRENGYAFLAQDAADLEAGVFGVRLARAVTLAWVFFRESKTALSMLADRGVDDLVPFDDLMGVLSMGLECRQIGSESRFPIECTGVDCSEVGWANMFPVEGTGLEYS